MPERLVTVFTPNYQSLHGVLGVIRQATEYRRASEDYRPLTVFPLPSRVDGERDDLRKQWRAEYQLRFEVLFHEIYVRKECDLSRYFDSVQLPHKSDFAFGERIAVLEESRGDSLSLSHAFHVFTECLIGLNYKG